MINYVTVDQVLRQLDINSSDIETGLVLDWIGWSSDLIRWWKDRRHDVYIDTILLDKPEDLLPEIGLFDFGVSSRTQLNRRRLTLKVPIDLLEVIELKNGDGTVIDSDDYVLLPSVTFPKYGVRLKDSATQFWTSSDDGNEEQVISLKGIFGYHRNYRDCWIDSRDTILNTGGIDDEETEIEVLQADGLSGNLRTPRFQTGQLLKAGSEFLHLVEITYGSSGENDTLSVIRGFNGSTASSHVLGTQLYVYDVPGDIAQMCIRLVQWRYRQKDADVFDKIYTPGQNVISEPSALPADVAAILGSRRAGLL